MHFNYSQATANTAPRKKHMKAIEQLAATLVARSAGQMKAVFHPGSFFDL